MPASFVRAHTTGYANTVGSTVAATIAATTTPGNVLAAVVATNLAVSASGISKPGGESASWTNLGTVSPGSRAELWVIKTTVAWAAATAVTASTPSANFRMILLAEYAGADAVVRATAATATATGTSPLPSASASAAIVQAGDLVLGVGTLAPIGADVIAVDSDTTAGAWAVATSLLGPTASFGYGLYATLQHKVATGPAAQTFDAQATTTTPGTVTRTVGAIAVVLKSTDVPPNAPTLVKPDTDAVMNRGAIIRLQWLFSSTNPTDVGSATDLRYRLVGAGSWTEIHIASIGTMHDFAPLDLAAGDYEWQVASYSAVGMLGPYSASGFFTAEDPPDGPTITYPIDGQTLLQEEGVTWSAAEQDAYQVRIVADDAGDPDPGTIYFDTGEVVDATTRSIPLTFDTNNITVHVQVRVEFDTLWSEWDDVSGDVSFTPPPAPSVDLYPDPTNGSIRIAITNPDPDEEEDEPAAVYNDVYIDDGDGEERRATGVALDGQWWYWTPVSGRDYADQVRVVAVAANSTTASSS